MIRTQCYSRDKERVDLQGLRRIMLELMEPRTIRLPGDPEELRHPNEWTEHEETGIMEFLQATTSATLDELGKVREMLLWVLGLIDSKHVFLPSEHSIRGYLKELVVIALFTASTVHQTVFTPKDIESQGSELWC